MLRVMRRPSCALPLMTAVAARWQSAGPESDAAAAAAAPAKGAPAEQKKDASAAAAPPQGSSNSSTAAPGSAAAAAAYRFPTDEVMSAVKKGDFNAMQSHATRLVQSQWREAYNVPAACVVIFVVMWYWIAWTRRSIRRKCEAMKAAVKQQTEEMVDIVRGMTEKWKGDMAKANKQMQGIIDKNSELTRDIDRMTTALRSCSIRPTPNSSGLVPPSVMMARRAVEEVEEAPADVAVVTVVEEGAAPAAAASAAEEDSA